MEFPTESQKQQESGALPQQNNHLPYVSRYLDYMNVERIRAVGPSCIRQFYCIVGDCCPIYHKVIN